jgi:hypothetical protein
MAVVQTNKYNNTAGGRSSDITVSQGESVTVMMYNADYSPLPANLQVPVLRFLGGTAYRQVPDNRDGPGMLTTSVAEIVINAPGTYALQVPPTASALKIDEIR